MLYIQCNQLNIIFLMTVVRVTYKAITIAEFYIMTLSDLEANITLTVN